MAAASNCVYLSSWIDLEEGIPHPPGPRRFVFLCGVEYAEPVAELLESRGYDCSQPLKGLQLGQRLHWLKEATQ